MFNSNPVPTQVVPFQFETHEINTILINDLPYFIAKDICDVLGIDNPTSALLKLDDDEKLTYKLYRSGQNREVNLINESGMYALVMRSNKPEAKRFRKWVTSEVLPSIRKTGRYELPPPPPLVERTVLSPNLLMRPEEVVPGITAYVIPNETHGYIITTQEVARAYRTTEYAIIKRRANHKELFEENKDYLFVLHKNEQGNHARSIFWTQSGFRKMGETIQKRPLRNTAKNRYVDMREIAVSTPLLKTPQYGSSKTELLDFVISLDDKEIRTQLFDKLKKLNLI